MRFFLIVLGLSSIFRVLIDFLFPLITGKVIVEIIQQSPRWAVIIMAVFYLITAVSCVFLAKIIDQQPIEWTSFEISKKLPEIGKRYRNKRTGRKVDIKSFGNEKILYQFRDKLYQSGQYEYDNFEDFWERYEEIEEKPAQ